MNFSFGGISKWRNACRLKVDLKDLGRRVNENVMKIANFRFFELFNFREPSIENHICFFVDFVSI